MTKNKIPIGAKVIAFGKSIHAGQTGTIAADYGNYILIKADDEKYQHAHKNSGREGKYFQVDELLLKQVKE